MKDLLFFDLEVDKNTKRIKDYGGILNGQKIHTSNPENFDPFLRRSRSICAHNLFEHDLKYLRQYFPHFLVNNKPLIDTLYLSPLLFPKKPYHKLVKDYQLESGTKNNPLADSEILKTLFIDCVSAYLELPDPIKELYYSLLHKLDEFQGFFKIIGYQKLLTKPIEKLITSNFQKVLCAEKDIRKLAKKYPKELAYCLALIRENDDESYLPTWLVFKFPKIHEVLKELRYTNCLNTACNYCQDHLDPIKALRFFFDYEVFRNFDGDEGISIQERVVRATLDGDSVLAVFPTGGGKSITYQLPALMIAKATRGLTVIISPLQSLMKDQVDVLKNRHGIVNAVTINGLLTPLERMYSIQRVEDGRANLLYISPESLRSNTIVNVLKKRSIARFVIDEAHCFSIWGQDFRVDYLYIGEFIKELREESVIFRDIPVSCFTATAKPQVIADINEYFRKKLNIEFTEFISKAKRTNLSYEVYSAKTEKEKEEKLLELVNQISEPKIIYVARTRKAEDVSERLSKAGYEAVCFHGKMENKLKQKNQERFMKGEVSTIVATSAFGMGVDKEDVNAVIHYEISSSLENYIQEAGRAGRNKKINARCYILFDESDLNKHFAIFIQSKLNQKDIQQIWMGIKKLTYRKNPSFVSALELAKESGWETENSSRDIGMGVTTSLAVLEESNFLKRKRNLAYIKADSFLKNDVSEALAIVNGSTKLDENQKNFAGDIVRRLIKRSRAEETRIEYLAESLGIEIKEMMYIISILREEKILGDEMDLSCYVLGNSIKKAEKRLLLYLQIENQLCKILNGSTQSFNIKDINEKIIFNGISQSKVDFIKDIIFFWESNNFIEKERSDINRNIFKITFKKKKIDSFVKRIQSLQDLSKEIFNFLKIKLEKVDDQDLIEFSITEVKNYLAQNIKLFNEGYSISTIQSALLYLNTTGAIKLEGGFLLYYKQLNIQRTEENKRRKYTLEDHKKLEGFYENKVAQIHVVGEYAKKMIYDHHAGEIMVDEYFATDFKEFLRKYFPRELNLIKKPLTRERFKKIMQELSDEQQKILNDEKSRFIIVAAGPGSGKTKILVHKIASLLIMEDVKPEQFLMLTFSRAAAIEFRKRIKEMVHGFVNHIDIYTFHSFCFDLLDQVGSIERSENIIKLAIEAIESKEISLSRIENKSVLVLDEFQDIGPDEYKLIQLIVEKSDEIKVIAVGDDDQSIYGFRGGDSNHMLDFEKRYVAKRYELLTNFRSYTNIVDFSNHFLRQIGNRYKTNLIQAITDQSGSISIVKNKSENLIPIVVKYFLNTKIGETTAVLTSTNEEALLIATELERSGIRAKVIMSNDRFHLSNLYEFRELMNYIYKETNNSLHVVTTDLWERSLEYFNQRFHQNSNYDDLLSVLKKFDQEYRQKSLSELRIFLKEVKIEHCIDHKESICIVSTMHKAKGLEFDNVFVLLQHHELEKDEQKRVVYVAMTRAKKDLTIITKYPYFDNIQVNGIRHEQDNTIYDSPKEISLITNPSHIALGFFKWEKTIPDIEKMQTDDEMGIVPGEDIYYLTNNSGKYVCRFSKDFTEKYIRWIEKGYSFKSARVNYKVKWYDKETEKEYYTILPRILLIKNY